MDELSICDECRGYGDDYYLSDDGEELICRCWECPMRRQWEGEDDE